MSSTKPYLRNVRSSNTKSSDSSEFVDEGSPLVGVGGDKDETLLGKRPTPSLTHSLSHNELLAAERGDESMLRRIREEAQWRLEAYRARVPSDYSPQAKPPAFFDLTLPLVHQGFTAVVDDSFTRCFKTKKVVRWNWNCYLGPCYYAGVIVRYGVLFPLRLLCLMMGFLVVSLLFPIVKCFSACFNTKAWEIGCV